MERIYYSRENYNQLKKKQYEEYLKRRNKYYLYKRKQYEEYLKRLYKYYLYKKKYDEEYHKRKNNINHDTIKNNNYNSSEINIEENNLEYKKDYSTQYDNLENSEEVLEEKDEELLEENNEEILEESYEEVLKESYKEFLKEYSEEKDEELLEEKDEEILEENYEEFLEEIHEEFSEKNEEYLEENNEEYLKEDNAEILEKNNEEYLDGNSEEILEGNNEEYIEENSEEVLEGNDEEFLEESYKEVFKESYEEFLEKISEEFLDEKNEKNEKDQEHLEENNEEILEENYEEFLEENSEEFLKQNYNNIGKEELSKRNNISTKSIYVKFPVILAETNITIPIEATITLDQMAMEIKRIKKNVFLTQSRLIPFSSTNINPNSGILFIAGFIRTNIEYETKTCTEVGMKNICGNIRHCSTDVPFNLTTRITFLRSPIFIESTNTIEVEFLADRTQVCDSCEDSVIGRDPCEQSYVFTEVFNEKPFVELVKATFIEIDIYKNPILSHESPSECIFTRITEKTTLNLTLKVLQEQQVRIAIE